MAFFGRHILHCNKMSLLPQGISRRYHELSFTATGDPAEVLEYHQTDQAKQCQNPHDEEATVLVAMKHAPWNPADMNLVQGRYASPYPKTTYNRAESLYFPGQTVAGSEGWGQVVSDESKTFKEGDWVTMGLSGLGTLRSHLRCHPDALIRVNRGQELMDAQGPRAAALFQLGGTAYRMLHDFLDHPTEAHPDGPRVIVQNAGNSGVGFMASQLASLICKDAAMVSLVRRNNRSQQDFEEMVDYLTVKGKNHLVVEEEELMDPEKMKALKDQLDLISKVELALNAVGGKSASILLDMLAPGGTHVTYGGMSMKPITVPTPQLIFKDVRVRGYWHSRWMVQHTHQKQKKEKMINELVDLVLSHDLVCPMVEVFGLSQAPEALKGRPDQSIRPLRRKVVFYCGEELLDD
jgi:trans-2-enoyl-CoA reductase